MKKMSIIFIFLVFGFQMGIQAFSMPKASLPTDTSVLDFKKMRQDLFSSVKQHKGRTAIITATAALLYYWGWISGVWLRGSKRKLWREYIYPHTNILRSSFLIPTRRNLGKLDEAFIKNASIPLMQSMKKKLLNSELNPELKNVSLEKTAHGVWQARSNMRSMSSTINQFRLFDPNNETDAYVEYELKNRLIGPFGKDHDLKRMFIRLAIACATDKRLYDFFQTSPTNLGSVVTGPSSANDQDLKFWGMVETDQNKYQGKSGLNYLIRLLFQDPKIVAPKVSPEPFPIDVFAGGLVEPE